MMMHDERESPIAAAVRREGAHATVTKTHQHYYCINEQWCELNRIPDDGTGGQRALEALRLARGHRGTFSRCVFLLYFVFATGVLFCTPTLVSFAPRVCRPNPLVYTALRATKTRL